MPRLWRYEAVLEACRLRIEKGGCDFCCLDLPSPSADKAVRRGKVGNFFFMVVGAFISTVTFRVKALHA